MASKGYLLAETIFNSFVRVFSKLIVYFLARLSPVTCFLNVMEICKSKLAYELWP